MGQHIASMTATFDFLKDNFAQMGTLDCLEGDQGSSDKKDLIRTRSYGWLLPLDVHSEGCHG